jgi:hypothetical protein
MSEHSRSAADRDYVSTRPPPAENFDRVVYGLTQPVIGARLLVSDGELLKAAMVPAALLAGACAVIALVSDGGSFLRRFYTTFAVMAPLPSIVFASHYARFAAQARHAFGFSSVEPCIEPLRRTIGRVIKQALLIALALAPITALLQIVPGLGWLAVKVIAAAWALHWVVVDAFDSARVLRPGQTLADLDAAALRVPPPWYVRWLSHAAERAPLGKRVIRWFAGVCDRLSMPWREEIAVVEQHPALMLGFALSTAILLALPILNLVFRPIVIAGATHVLGQLEIAGADAQHGGRQR